MNGLEQKKNLLRAQVKPLVSKVNVSWTLLDKFLNIQDCQFIGLFSPLNDEPEIIDFPKALKHKATLSWPKIIDPAQSQMSFFKSDDFQKSELGFLEPSSQGKEIFKEQLELIFVPGVAFDFKGQRLGRGKGFYDRYLKDFKGITVGVCSSERFLKEPIPVDQKFDVSVQYILTEQFLYQVNPVRKVV